MERVKGSIIIDERGDVIILSRLDVQADMQQDGSIPTFDIGTYLRSRNSVAGSRWSGSNYRVVCHAEDMLRLLEQSGLDIRTPASQDTQELPEVVRLRQQNEHLAARLRDIEIGRLASVK
jgi:hypothetical protein